MTRKILSLSLLLFFLLSFSTEAQAQRKKKKKKRPAKTEESSSNSKSNSRSSDSGSFLSNDKLTFDILGTLSFDQLGGASALSIGFKPSVGYKLLPWLHSGLALKYKYYFVNITNAPDFSYHDYGVGLFTRAVFLNQFYAQLEYDLNSFEAYTLDREFRSGFMLGGGYFSGFGRWGYGAQALFELNEGLRDYDTFPLEIWIGVHYNISTY